MPDVIFPCLDEAAALPWLLPRVPDGFRAIVVDNGSTDGSPDIARSFGATVIDAPQRGFGAAAHAGLEAATDDVVCFCDADGSLDPQELPTVAAGLRAADLVLGRRRPVSRAAFPLHGRLGNAALARRLRRRCGIDVHDLGPMRAARRTALLDLGITDRRFGYPLEMVVLAAAAGWRVAEVDVAYFPRAAGTKSKVTGTVTGTVRAARDMRAVLAR